MSTNDDVNKLLASIREAPGLNVVFFAAGAYGAARLLYQAGKWVIKQLPDSPDYSQYEYVLSGRNTVAPAGLPKGTRQHYFNADTEATALRVLKHFQDNEEGYTWSLSRQ